MSAGTTKYPVRFPPDLMEEIRLAIARRNTFTDEEVWTLSDFIRVACREKLSKMARCRRPRKKAGR